MQTRRLDLFFGAQETPLRSCGNSVVSNILSQAVSRTVRQLWCYLLRCCRTLQRRMRRAAPAPRRHKIAVKQFESGFLDTCGRLDFLFFVIREFGAALAICMAC